MELTPRLQAIARQVPAGTVLADVGTDHALLPVRLLLDGQISYAIASDLREGPLARARETAARYGVTDQVSFRLCDGLAGIGPEEADTVSIAGMGGETIAAILAAAPWTRDGKRLLLQPMTSFPDLRRWLWNNGYMIQNEFLAQEGKRLYTIWNVIGGKSDPFTTTELWVGRNHESPLRREYLAMMKEKVSRALAGHRASAVPDQGAMAELEEVLTGIIQMERELEA